MFIRWLSREKREKADEKMNGVEGLSDCTKFS